jgi:hypothetical protein
MDATRMKNRLNKLWNLAPRNPTQTRYNRFRTGPRGELRTGFTDAIESFEKAMNERKTIYQKYIGDL